MKIIDVRVDGFGAWRGLELAELSDLTVFYGPNEAGKTTLMQFVRSVLYGFSAERRAKYLPPFGGGRAGGTLELLDGQRQLAISRHGDDLHDLGDAVVIADGRETVATERTLHTLLGGVDEPIFNNIFAFGLREIQELGTLGDAEAARELYALAAGLDRVSLVDVLVELESSRNRLLASDDRPSLVTQLLGQRERLQAEIEELGQSTVRYLGVLAQRDRLASEIAELEVESQRLEKQVQELALTRSLGERWTRRAAVDQQLAALAGADLLPERALARFEHLQVRLTACRKRYRKLKRRKRKLQDEIKQLAINEPLVRHSVRFEALSEQQPWMQSLEAELKGHEDQVLELESQLEATGGAKGSLARAPAATLSKRSLQELREAAKALREARRAEREYLASLPAGPNSAELTKQIESALGPAKDKGLTQALAEAGDLVAQLRKRVQIDERIDQLSRREADLEDQSHEQVQNQALPTWALAGLGALFVLGCALVLLFVAGLVLPASLSGALGWHVGAIGVLAAGAAGAVKFWMERTAVGQLDGCQQQLQLLKDQMKQLRAERDALDAQLPKGGGPLVARLQTAEKSLAKLEELVPLQARQETAQRDAAQSEARATALRNQRRAQHKRWCRLLLENGLPAKTVPRQLRELARRQARSQGLVSELDEARQQHARRKAEYETLVARIKNLMAEAGLKPRSERPLDQLRQGLAELAEQQKLLKVRDELARRLSEVRRKLAPLVESGRVLRKRHQRLLRRSGVANDAEFLRLAQAQAETGRLRSERARLSQEIAATLAGQLSEELLAERLTNPLALEQLEAVLTATRQSLQARLAAALEQRGALAQQMRTLVDDRQLAHKRLELNSVEKRLHDALARWRVLAITGLMLAAVRDYYEREHQPQALREASEYLKRLTGGRYRRVWTPLGQHLLKVEDKAGHSLTADVLSSGTREQLFLALRLALVTAFARRGVRLPLVLDDVLVNFDVGRAKAAATVLRDFAQHGHQLLVFTCHEHIAKLFRQAKADVRLLPDNAAPQTNDDEAAGRRARRLRPEPPVQPVPEPEVDEVEQVEAMPEPEPEPIPTMVAVPETSVALVTPAPAIEVVMAPSAILVEAAPVEIPLAIDIPPAIVEEAEPPRPEPMPAPRPLRPARQPRRRALRGVHRVRWSAEEFDGELADRVRSVELLDEEDAEQLSHYDDALTNDEAEAA